MRAVLTILGIAVAFVGISVAFSALTGHAPSKRGALSPNPQIDEGNERDKEQQAAAKDADKAKQQKENREFKPPMEGVMHSVLEVKGRGRIVIELYPKAAPKTVARFTELLNGKFYDGIKVHRVEPSFVVQAGDPKSKELPIGDPSLGSHGSGTPMPWEDSKLPHAEGTVAIALQRPRTSTGDSQFFINLKANNFLNDDYCVFGKVIEGMDVVKTIKVGDEITSFTVTPEGAKPPTP